MSKNRELLYNLLVTEKDDEKRNRLLLKTLDCVSEDKAKSIVRSLYEVKDE